MASKLSHSAIVAHTHTSKTSFSLCATLSGLRLSSIRAKWSKRSRKPERRTGSWGEAFIRRAPNREPHGFSLSATRKSPLTRVRSPGSPGRLLRDAGRRRTIMALAASETDGFAEAEAGIERRLVAAQPEKRLAERLDALAAERVRPWWKRLVG